MFRLNDTRFSIRLLTSYMPSTAALAWAVIGLSACSFGKSRPSVLTDGTSALRLEVDGDASADASESNPTVDASAVDEPSVDASETLDASVVDASSDASTLDSGADANTIDASSDAETIDGSVDTRTAFTGNDPCAALDLQFTPLATVTGAGATDSPGILTSWRAAIVGDQLCLQIMGTGLLDRKYTLCLDTDGNPNTGIQAPLQYWQLSGADYIFNQDVLYRATGQSWDDKVDSGVTVLKAGRTDSELDISLPLTAFAADGSAVLIPAQGIGLGFQVTAPSTFDVADYLPRGSELARIGGSPEGQTPTSAACMPLAGENADFVPPACSEPNGGAMGTLTANLDLRIDIGRGIIIPAYLTVTDPKNVPKWALLATGALHSALSIGTYRDYFVVVNGPSSGPLDDSLWGAARLVWDPIVANGGHIFGYVHTGMSYQDPVTHAFVVNPEFRSLSTIEQEISTWVCNYPALDGIWIDEFNPRFEVATTDAATPNFPNKEALRPTDPRITDTMTAAQFNATAIDPACGYYDRLTTWIHTTYPHLRIIGNAGASLPGNQRRYARLVDVLAGFESSLYRAEQNNWAALTAGVEPLAYANLALIHAGDLADVQTKAPTNTRKAAIDAAFGTNLYTHVYTTDNLHGGNLWGDLPADPLGRAARYSISNAGIPVYPDATVDSGLLNEVDAVSNHN